MTMGTLLSKLEPPSKRLKHDLERSTNNLLHLSKRRQGRLLSSITEWQPIPRQLFYFWRLGE